jgi:hypothetical protein
LGINTNGTILGTYADGSGNSQVFLRASGGTFTTFDPPGSTFTNTVSINSGGEITGDYIDVNFASHGFVFANH